MFLINNKICLTVSAKVLNLNLGQHVQYERDFWSALLRLKQRNQLFGMVSTPIPSILNLFFRF